MKTLHLLRHAKSSWDQPELADIDRPLNQRGLRSCRRMATALAESPGWLENLHCSPARRAQATLEQLSLALPSPLQWQTEPALYCFDSHTLLTWLARQDDQHAQLTLVGHNPALTELCNTLGDNTLNNLPTCGYVRLVSPTLTHWADILAHPFQQTAFLRPKDLTD
ncbi:SixA phosphatase family protein [Ferrimonas marina]|uniref:Phosphohistidine phosphatase n=1 Tax=Ferrimonas marina TaxID=299255 RepID=A0A1M5VTK5_9GAMM|nr:histidine phosphatase family protein [Ferrimonas marina]SHH78334.1 phosphohistidine phosphatase [Ferrimonas marina]